MFVDLNRNTVFWIMPNTYKNTDLIGYWTAVRRIWAFMSCWPSGPVEAGREVKAEL